MIDVAIIGGGVSGCYCAYRLTRPDAPKRSVHLFEMSTRIGGRLFSAKAEGVDDYMIEFGGMFISSKHENVLPLIQYLGLKERKLTWRHGHQYLRRRVLIDDDYATPEKIPYFLDDDERKLAPSRLLKKKIFAQFERLPALWPFKAGVAPRKTAEYLREQPWRGRPLHDWGFWNFLNEIASNEAYELMLSTFGSAAMFRNANAYDTIWTWMFENQPGQTWYQLEEGYQSLPLKLLQDAQEGGAQVHPESKLDRVEAAEAGVKLFFGRGEIVEAKHLILALPRAALEKIGFDAAFESGFKPALASAIQVPSCKLFMAFDKPWWNDAAFRMKHFDDADIAVSSTDMPMRQCYYYGKPDAAARSLLLASYADDAAESFWKGLRGPGYCNSHYPSLVAGAGPHLCATEAMVSAATRQLQTMHPNYVVTGPVGANFHDWSDEPYGAAWHSWASYCKSWEVAKSMRRPDPRLPIYVCGEAYAHQQGWVEGAITTAELVLQESLQLSRAEWLPEGYELAIEEGR